MKEDLEDLLLSIMRKIRANNCYMEMSEEQLFKSIGKSLEVEYKKLIKLINDRLSYKIEMNQIDENQIDVEYQKEYSELEKQMMLKTYSISAMNKAEVENLKYLV